MTSHVTTSDQLGARQTTARLGSNSTTISVIPGRKTASKPRHERPPRRQDLVSEADRHTDPADRLDHLEPRDPRPPAPTLSDAAKADQPLPGPLPSPAGSTSFSKPKQSLKQRRIGQTE